MDARHDCRNTHAHPVAPEKIDKVRVISGPFDQRELEEAPACDAEVRG